VIEPYAVFLALTVLLWALSTSRDRNALRVVLIASLASEVIVDEITRQIQAPWKLIIPGFVEILTILALLRWARNRTGYLMASLLCVAWASHWMCYADIMNHTNLVYSRYEAILYAVSAGQLATCYDTIIHTLRRAVRAGLGLVSFCFDSVRTPRMRACVSDDSCRQNLPASQTTGQ
jgi:hypothetical protein